MANIKKEIVIAWRLYNRWRKLSTYCPALKKHVRFSLQGWYHITGEKGAKKRTFGDAYRRLKLLPHARAIILKSSTFQDIQSGSCFPKRNHGTPTGQSGTQTRSSGKSDFLLSDGQKKEKAECLTRQPLGVRVVESKDSLIPPLT